MLHELGGLGEGYQLYEDNSDLAQRARKTGWERWYLPDAIVVRYHQAVTDRCFFTKRTAARPRFLRATRRTEHPAAGCRCSRIAPGRTWALRGSRFRMAA